jgi:hypothetical protein
VHGFNTKRKDITMSNTSKLPSHRVYAVTKNGQRNYWREIGAAWAHGDGEGFNLKLAGIDLNHIPIWRVHESTRVLRDLGATVTERVCPSMGHNDDEIRQVTKLIAQLEQHEKLK